jgi:hypothetical protein
MSMSIRTGWLAGCAALTLFAGAAAAEPITYIFTGSGLGLLDGVVFTGTFTITDVADTSGVFNAGGGEIRDVPTSSTFASSAGSASLSHPLVIENTENMMLPGFMGFADSSTFADESIVSTVFETYNLTSSLASTTGALSVAPATFDTSVGALVFLDITALSFEATVASVPEPSAVALLATILLACGAIRLRAYRNSTRAEN